MVYCKIDPAKHPQNVMDLMEILKKHWRFSGISAVKYIPLAEQSTIDSTGFLVITPAESRRLPVGFISHITEYDSSVDIEFSKGSFKFLIFKHRPTSSGHQDE